MKTRLAPAVLSLLLLTVLGCSSPDHRIRDHEALFKSLSIEDQGKIRGGHVDIGFTVEMVEMALGKPDRQYSRTTAQGTSEVWAYGDHGPTVSLGFGVGGGGSGVGVGVTGGGDHRDDKARVIFENGRVTAIEHRGQT